MGHAAHASDSFDPEAAFKGNAQGIDPKVYGFLQIRFIAVHSLYLVLETPELALGEGVGDGVSHTIRPYV